MKKPLPVKIVEAIGWVYALLLSLGVVVGIATQPSQWVNYIVPATYGFTLIVFMRLALRKGRRAWFVVEMAALWVGVIVVFASLDRIWPITSLTLLILPIVLLYFPSSDRWLVEKSCGAPVGKCYGVVCIVVGLAILVEVILPMARLNYVLNEQSRTMSMFGRPLLCCMLLNNVARESGEDWVDPASCTNSTQFVQALCEKYKDDFGECPCNLGPYTNIWCIAVNPPKEDLFPMIFTCNIDPRELLSRTEGDRDLTLTCPKACGVSSFNFCEKMALIIRVCGAAQIVRNKYSSPNHIFSGDIPKPNPDTYFLTPTGRVDFVERQAADWLSIHEFASNEDPGDVSVKWRVAWPESLSGLNNEGLSSVRREILQMTFGPAWSDLNHGDKTWIPPPTIEEAEEEIKRKLEEPDIVWEFSGDVELDRPFGASLQDGAEWYARPVIVAKNEGNSSFRWECGCTYYTIARTFSIPDGREMTVDDYFDRGKMKELSALVWRRLLESVFPFDDETRKGMGHRDINLRDRNLIFMRVMSGGICFYFAPYSIFSGAEGVTKAFLKWGELSKFRKK